MHKMNKIIITILISVFLTLNVNADTDGDNKLSKQDSTNVKDCFEGINRGIFAFNKGLDNVIFEPVAKVYRKLPSPIKIGTGNVVSNLSNLVTIPNNILQGDIKTAGINTGRLVVNSTIGFLGVFDVATSLGFRDYEKEDYGQSLGVAGFGPGCYLVLPIIGPSSSRDAVGTLVNMFGGDPWYNITVKNDTNYVNESDYYASRITAGTDFRAKNIDSIDNLEENSMDFYASVKSLYLQDRQQKILNSKKSTNTQNDDDWEEIETN